MALFRPYERKQTTSTDHMSTLTPKGAKAAAKAEKRAGATEVEAAAEPAAATGTTAPQKIKVPRKKDTPTPSRRQAEAARMERLHPSLTPKQQRKADARARQQERMENWERTENSPARQLVRDYVDTRWTVAEFMLPAMILVMAAVMATMSNPVLSSYIAMGLWVLLLITIINVAIMWRGYKKLLAERHPNEPTRGLLIYMFNRSLMIRRFRHPGPRVRRGEPI
ncbi:DUF3043 domain-containing protein [Tessaracoccus massiliensis]|uniref:DUF3043 domain-containing protein n=1 Tax=Tessaracoccus massiliensis TaxID=1522311 RepID=UPI0006938647|nr:DUF3043 domain-containing protein [Tessaracoccus massiliensis]